MVTYECRFEENIARIFEEESRKAGVDVQALLQEVLLSYARRRELDRRWENIDVEAMKKLYDECADEEIALAEAGMEDYARGLLEEDRA